MRGIGKVGPRNANSVLQIQPFFSGLYFLPFVLNIQWGQAYILIVRSPFLVLSRVKENNPELSPTGEIKDYLKLITVNKGNPTFFLAMFGSHDQTWN